MNLEIFILTYNRKESLELSINSILSQTFKKFDLIILDNRSDYDVNKFTLDFNDSRVKTIINEKNIGPVENFAKAVRLASKEFLMIFHDDDTLPNNFIENQINLFNQHKNIGFIVSGINLTSSIDNMKSHEVENLKYILFDQKGDMLKCFYDFPTFGASSIMFKTNVAKLGIIGYEKFGNVVDRMMLLKCSSEYSFIYMISPKYKALQHDNQDSSNRNWSFDFDINLSNYLLYYLNEFKLHNYKMKVVKSISEFFVYSKDSISIFSAIKNIKFIDKNSKIYFIILIPVLYIKSRILLFIKKRFLNLFVKINHIKYKNKLRKTKYNTNFN